MIRVEELVIREFRGIRNLRLTPAGKNFAICGPNGTGKSGVVDAIEFALTGEISRLSGRGTGGLSVRAHGPHVDSRDKPNDSSVEAKLYVPALKSRATIRRTIKDARAPTLTPYDPQIAAVLIEVGKHPEFVLSRRELIRYVLSEPGKRSEEVQALLRLDELEDLRTALQRIANAAEKEAAAADKAQRNAVDQLVRALGISKLSGQELLAAVNARRQILAIPYLERLEVTTSICDGLATEAGLPTPSRRIVKAQAKTDMQTARSALTELVSESALAAAQACEEEIASLEAEPIVANAAEQEALLATALGLFDEVHCPVCDTEWDPEAFRARVAGKREQIRDALLRRRAAGDHLARVAERLEAAAAALAAAAGYGPLLSPPIDVSRALDARRATSNDAAVLKRFLPLSDTLAALSRVTHALDADTILGQLEAGIAALPDPSDRDAARDYLTIGQVKLEAYRAAAADSKTYRARAVTARKVFDLFGVAVTDALGAVYKAVEARFITLYRIVNREDEDAFEARLTPSLGKLGFDVDFYGRGFFPPGAYHSEGHQDGMGLCLYLALMDHLLGKDFTFAVLDDVLMSVDTGHRREVCRMLKTEFPHTQFLLTTHDDIWLRHMKSEGLIASNACVHFRKWDVAFGPTEWNDLDVWRELDEHLSKNDVRSAAALLRHYLEYFGQEVCHRLRARVEFRGDAQFVLSDTLPNALKALGDMYKRGREAAQSWKQDAVADIIRGRETAFGAAKAATRVDEWQVNASVHYNAWGNFARGDFEPVVAGYRDLTRQFACERCDGLLYVSPDRGEKLALRCGCGVVNINLNRK